MMKWRFVYRGLKARYRNQRTELRSLIDVLSPDHIAIDVGANKGSYLWSLSRAVPKGRVVAFEPQPVLINYLRQACSAAGLNNITIVGAGVSNVAGSLTLAIPPCVDDSNSSPGASFETAVSQRENCQFIDVPMVTLDDYFINEKARIGALKIDVEGHELSVLNGAINLIKKHRPTIVCECEQRHLSNGAVKNVIDFIQSQHYMGFLITNKGLIPALDFDPSVHQKHMGERYWDKDDYYNNFVFKPMK
jgi:FkbM family methyltransferase